MLRSRLRVALLAVASLCAAGAHAQPFTSDIDLVFDDGLVHYSQTDFRWGGYGVGPARQRRIEECGCLLAAFATVMNHKGGRGMLPWYPTALAYGTSAFDFNPRYLDLYLLLGPSLGNPRATGWGYKPADDPQFCGTSPLISALRGLGSDGMSTLGFRAVIRAGNGANVQRVIDRNLRNGNPTVIVRQMKVTGANDATHHVFVVAGWDNDVKQYRVLDPMSPRSGLAGVYRPQVPVASTPGQGTDATYEKWWAGVVAIIDLQPSVGSGGLNTFVFGDDPSPIEIVMTEPSGQRTGYDPAAATWYDSDESGASYWFFGPFAAPLDDDDADVPGVAPRFITYPGAADGRYYFKVTGVADGPLHLTAETLLGGTHAMLAEFTGSIAAGEVRKYELDYVRAGASAVRQVTNFSPRAEAGEDRNGRTDFALAFDGRRSFDADGTIASYSWDFGDGAFGSGAQPQHVYATPGSYTVRLTVTDAVGATAADTMRADVVLSQRAPVAHASGPYAGFVSTPTLPFPVFLDARGSSDPNGEALTYRWTFGDGSPSVVTTTPFTAHPYAALGEYTLQLVVNDGIDDSAPATTTVTVYQAPTSPPFGQIDDDLVPNCGRPGDTATLILGEFARFDTWNLGTQGALPPLPTNLPIGVFAPPGLIEIGFGGVWSGDVPFEARLLSPGRYLAEAKFVVPNVGPGTYTVFWGEGDEEPFKVPCPLPLNQAPLADAGGPYAGAVGAPITFDGSASSDPDDDGLDYEWHFGDGEIGVGDEPEHTYAAEGTYLVTLIVSDGFLNSAATAGGHSFAATVVTSGSGNADAIPPVTTAVHDPAATAAGWNKTPVTVELTAADNPGGTGVRDIAFALSGAESGAAVVPGESVSIGIATDGVTTVQFFATDRAGNAEVPQQHVVRIDRTGPTIAGMPAPGCTLWPPNHKLVKIASISAADLGTGLVPGSLRISVTSSEPADALGDGSTASDIVISGGSVSVRAERSGPGAGRTYTVVAEAEDLAGNTARVQATCVVPHDQRH